jgi:hypothetical protein
MKVYVVFKHCLAWESPEVEDIFLSQEAADKFIATKTNPDYSYSSKEFEVKS